MADSSADLVLRGVPAELGVAEVAQALALPAAAITRFHRTRRGKSTPLPLVRVRVPHDTRASLLRAGGRDVAGTWCTVEVPLAPPDGPAAAGSTRGTRAEDEEEALRECVERAVLVERGGAPARWAPRVGELVYVRARPAHPPVTRQAPHAETVRRRRRLVVAGAEASSRPSRTCARRSPRCD